jgi:hypothetical protein
MHKLPIKVCFTAVVTVALVLISHSASAADDTARFVGQWKTTTPMNGQMVTVVSVHDASNYTNYVLTPNGFVPAVTGTFIAKDGKYLATSPTGNLTGGYRFLSNDSVILTNAAGQPFTWVRDNTSLPGVTPPPAEPPVVLPSAPPTLPDTNAAGRTTHNRGFDDDAPAAPSDLPPGSSYALVIGIDDYTSPLPKLKTAVNDAKSMADLLSRQYGFQVTSLLNQDATRDNIFKAITHFRKSLAENDDFLIYYAGHGSYDRDTQKGYWLPVDADPDPLVTSRNISSDDLITEVRGLAARHVIIISDSCFSGDLSRAAGDFSPSDGNQAYIHRMERAPSRTLMASGSDEPVSDAGSQGHSVFADLLLHALQSQSEKSFTAEDLFVSIRKSVLSRSSQSPQYTALRDTMRSSANPASHASGSLDNGDFVFNRNAAAEPTSDRH